MFKNSEEKSGGFIEVVSYSQAQNTSYEEGLAGLGILDKFYKSMDGYYGMVAAEGLDNSWVLVLKWESKEHEQRASQQMMKSSETDSFKMTVDPTSFKKNIYPTVNF